MLLPLGTWHLAPNTDLYFLTSCTSNYYVLVGEGGQDDDDEAAVDPDAAAAAAAVAAVVLLAAAAAATAVASHVGAFVHLSSSRSSRVSQSVSHCSLAVRTYWLLLV